jgi:hypothetical protein
VAFDFGPVHIGRSRSAVCATPARRVPRETILSLWNHLPKKPLHCRSCKSLNQHSLEIDTSDAHKQTVFGIAIHNTIHHLVGGEILLVPTDYLDRSMLLVGGEECEVLQYIQHYARLKDACDCRLYVLKLAFLLALVVSPWKRATWRIPNLTSRDLYGREPHPPAVYTHADTR